MDYKTAEGKNGNRTYVHIIRWEQFHGKRRKHYQIHHIDGNKQNNNIDNLVELRETYHSTYHKMCKILNKSIRQMNLFIGMVPSDTDEFYNKITSLADAYGICIESEMYSARRAHGSGLSKEEAIKTKMVEAGKKNVRLGKLPYQRSSTSETNKCKERVIKYFGTLKNYLDICQK